MLSRLSTAAVARPALSRFRFYSASVHDHFSNPRNVGSMDANDPSVGTAVVGKAACGDVIRLQVRVEDDKIKDVKFKTFGCGSAIASSSYASEMITGMSLKDALAVKSTDVARHLSLPPVKLHCSLLAEDAIHRAIQDYKKKKEILESSTSGA